MVEKKIGNSIELLVGPAFKSDLFSENEEHTRLARGINITRGVMRWEDDKTKYWDESEHDLSKFHLKEEDILIPMDGSLVGRNFAQVKNHDIPAILVQRVACIRTNDDIDQSFLYAWVSSSYFKNYVDSVKTNTGIPHISSKDIKNFKINLPPLPEQKKIASILSTVDEAIQNVKAQIERTTALKKGLMQKLFSEGIGHTEFKESKLGRIPREWEVVRLGDVLESKPVYGAGSASIPFDSNSTYWYLRITDIDSDGNLIEKNRVGISKDEGKQYLLDQDDILIARTGNTVGKSFKYDNKYGLCSYAGYLIKFIVNKKKLLPDFLFHFLHSTKYYNWVVNESRVGAQPNINSQIYQSLKFSLPSINEQSTICKVLNDVKEKLDILHRELHVKNDLKKGLMQKLLTGEVRVKVN